MKQKFVAQETGNKPMWRWDVLSRSERQEALRKHDKIAQETGFGAKLSGDYRKEFAAFMW